MQRWAREHVGALSALLSVVALSLVFATALRVVPPGLLPRSELLVAVIPHVNAAISVAAAAVIAAGWRWIRRGRVERHRRAMGTAVALFGAFLALYLYKVAVAGPKSFEGPGVVETFVYYPLLAVHVLLAVVCVPLLFYVLLLALTHPVAELPDTLHPRVGRVTAALWLTSFVLGVAVYVLLYLAY